jgi:hypothetical protein
VITRLDGEFHTREIKIKDFQKDDKEDYERDALKQSKTKAEDFQAGVRKFKRRLENLYAEMGELLDSGQTNYLIMNGSEWLTAQVKDRTDDLSKYLERTCGP